MEYILGNRKILFALGAAFFILCLIIYIKILKNEVNLYKSKNVELQLKIEIAETSIKDLKDSVDNQNKAIQAMKEESDKREKMHREEINRAKSKSENFKKQAKDIMELSLPTNKSACDAANDLINSEIIREKLK